MLEQQTVYYVHCTKTILQSYQATLKLNKYVLITAFYYSWFVTCAIINQISFPRSLLKHKSVSASNDLTILSSLLNLPSLVSWLYPHLLLVYPHFPTCFPSHSWHSFPRITVWVGTAHPYCDGLLPFSQARLKATLAPSNWKIARSLYPSLPPRSRSSAHYVHQYINMHRRITCTNTLRAPFQIDILRALFPHVHHCLSALLPPVRYCLPCTIASRAQLPHLHSCLPWTIASSAPLSHVNYCLTCTID